MDFLRLLIIILSIGFILIIIDLTKMYYNCPPNKTIYKFIPRTFEEDQDYPVPISDIFKQLFDAPSPWIGSFVPIKTARIDLNKYYISQV